MSRSHVIAPLAAAALAVALTGLAAPALASPATPSTATHSMASCRTLEERMVADHEKYLDAKASYGPDDPRTKKAYDTWQQAEHAYEKCL